MGGGVTVTVAEPSLPSLVALISAVPARRAVTSPVDDTEATSVSLEVQVTVRPSRALPPSSFTVAVAWVLAPTATLGEAMATLTEATGTGPVMPSPPQASEKAEAARAVPPTNHRSHSLYRDSCFIQPSSHREIP